MHNTDHLIGSAEAARRLRIDRATFNRWVAAGRIEPALSIPGKTGARLYDPADIDALAQDEKAAS